MVSMSTLLLHQRLPRNLKDKRTPGCYSGSWMQRMGLALLASHLLNTSHPSICHCSQASPNSAKNKSKSEVVVNPSEFKSVKQLELHGV